MSSFAETTSDLDPIPASAAGYFYSFDGAAWMPTGASRSPWNAGAINGMSVAGLLMHLAEQVPAAAPMLPAHVTIDILRPVPFAPTLTRQVVTREGRKMQMVESHLLAGGEMVARARVLRVREADSPVVAAPGAHAGPDETPAQPYFPPGSPIGRVVETRRLAGGSVGAPKGAFWARFVAELAPQIPISGVVQAAMLSDFGTGLARLLDPKGWTFANLDISLHMVRRPDGDWILAEGDGLTQGLGIGLTNIALADRLGQFGRAQTLFIAPVT